MKPPEMIYAYGLGTGFICDAAEAVLIPVPEAELAAGGHRHRLDRATARGFLRA